MRGTLTKHAHTRWQQDRETASSADALLAAQTRRVCTRTGAGTPRKRASPRQWGQGSPCRFVPAETKICLGAPCWHIARVLAELAIGWDAYGYNSKLC